jgi:hypothetical protein
MAIATIQPHPRRPSTQVIIRPSEAPGQTIGRAQSFQGAMATKWNPITSRDDRAVGANR